MSNRAPLWVRQEVVGRIIRNRFVFFCLYWLAYVWRRVLLRTTLIVVTGSLGKTTTKECLARVLSSKASTHKTLRNQNGLRLFVLTVLRIRPWNRFAVVEAGVGKPGDMEPIARLLRPDIAVILCVRRTHTTEFRDLDQHAREKEVLVKHIRRGGIAILNADDPRVSGMATGESWESRGIRRVTFGRKKPSDASACDVRFEWPRGLSLLARVEGQSVRIKTQLIGEHWTHSVLATVATSNALGVDLEQTAKVFEEAPPFPGRLEMIHHPSGGWILRDDYNASIDTLEAAMQVMAGVQAKRRLLAIVDFSDFGRNRKQRLKYLARRGRDVCEVILFAGEKAKYGRRRAIEEGFSAEDVFAFDSMQDLAQFLRSEMKKGDVVLVKGRTTDHAARIVHAQFRNVECWQSYCPKRLLCDFCWEL